MDINANLNGETAEKIIFLQKKKALDVEDVLKNAVDVYYEQEINKHKSTYEIFAESGLIACFEGDSNLSKDAEKYLRDSIDEGLTDS